ncbi:MAG: protein kinase [Gemmataceae bacterium]|nr:protein kinase [Gemmataceae bacterium]
MSDLLCSHPSREQLKFFRQGIIHDPNEMDNISRHLDQCRECLNTLEQLEADTFENLIHQAYQQTNQENGLDLSFLEPAESPLELGRIGQYRILKILGQGGMGMVFQAEDIALDRSVALKVIRRESAQKPEARERFFREAKLAASIQDDHIVPIYHAGEANGVPFMVMPWLQGESLADRMKRVDVFPVPEILRIGQQIAKGLAVAHEAGLIHRDIQPSNLWLEVKQGDRIKILDFGLARVLDKEKKQLTQSGIILGTPAYMSPEQAQAKPVGPACDLFSLGVILYRLATGRMPFEGDQVTSLLVAVVTHNPVAPHKINPEISENLSEFIMQLLAKDETKRPQSARYVAEKLEKLARDFTKLSQSTRPKIIQRVVPTVALMGVMVIILVAASVFYFQTPKGTVRVEINDDSLEATLTKTGTVIKGADKSAEIRVETGEQTLKIKRGDFEFETEKFLLRKGENITLRVELLPGKVQITRDGQILNEQELPKKTLDVTKTNTPKWVNPKKDVIDEEIDYDQKVADWATKIGAKFEIDPVASMKKKLDINSTKKFPIISLSFPENVKINDSDLEILKHCQSLKAIAFISSSITDEGINHLIECKSLSLLHIEGVKLTSRGLKNLSKLSNLYALSLINIPIEDQGLTELTKLTSLTNLSIHNGKITDKGLESIAQMKKIEKLDISFNPITDEGIRHLFDMTQLKTLLIRETKVSSKGISDLKTALLKCTVIKTTNDHFAALSVLRRNGEILVNVGNRFGNDNKRVRIKNHTDLNRIVDSQQPWQLLAIFLPNDTYLTDKSIYDYSGLQYLDTIELFRSRISEEGIKLLVHNPELRRVGLQEVNLTDSSLKHLKKLTKLWELNLAQTGVTDNGLKELVELKELYHLDLRRNQITDEGLKVLANIKSLKTLYLDNTKVTEAGIQELKKALPNCKITY